MSLGRMWGNGVLRARMARKWQVERASLCRAMPTASSMCPDRDGPLDTKLIWASTLMRWDCARTLMFWLCHSTTMDSPKHKADQARLARQQTMEMKIPEHPSVKEVVASIKTQAATERLLPRGGRYKCRGFWKTRFLKVGQRS